MDMEEIKIRQNDNKTFIVEQGNKESCECGWDEMMGLVASLTIPENKPCLGWMKEKKKQPSFIAPGTFLSVGFGKTRYIAIAKGASTNKGFYSVDYYAILDEDIILDGNYVCSDMETATEKEKQLLLNALHKEGKDWDAENKKVIDYEPPYVPQSGDFVTFNYPDGLMKVIGIFKSDINADPSNGGYYDLYAAHFSNGTINTPCSFDSEEFHEICPATEEEKNIILSSLHKIGKDWNAEKKEIVGHRWKPKCDEQYHYPLYLPFSGKFIPEPTIWVNLDLDTTLYNRGYVCQTSQECQEMCNKLNDAIKSALNFI